MRIAFAGTPEFSVAALEALRAAGHEIAGVFTQPDRPAGRGQKLSPSPVAQCADKHGLPLFKPEKFREEAQSILRGLQAELMIVVAYGLILPQAALDIPPRGCLNIHASLLPRWRGAAPIQRAIEAGDTETGITIMRMEAGLDTGPMLAMERLAITPHTTAAELHDALAVLGARLIVQTLAQLKQGALQEIPQPPQGVTYAHKLSKDEARLDWQLPAPQLLRRIHAFNPVPGAWCEFAGERLRVLRAVVLADQGAAEPGAVTGISAEGLQVAAAGGNGLQLREIQFAGGKPLSGAQLQQVARSRALIGRRLT